MATEVGSIFVSLGLSTGDLEAGVDDAVSSLEDMGRQMRDIGSTLTRRLTLPLTAAGGAALKFASDAEEMQDKSEAVFQDLTGDIREWADTTADEINRSALQLEEYAVSLADTLVPMGFARDRAAEFSQTLTELAVDLASFNNIAEDRALQALQSGLVGNTRALRQFGVVINQSRLEQELMNEGMAESVQAATEQEKAMARLNLIMQDTQDAQGDAARTSDSFRNQLRGLRAEAEELAAEFGEVLIPVASDLLQTTRGLLEEFRGLDEGTRQVIAQVGALAAALGPVALVAGQATIALKGLAGVLGGGMLAGITAVTGTGLGVWLMEQRRKTNDFNEVVGDAITRLEEMRASLDGMTDADQLGALEETLAAEARAIEARIREVSREIDETTGGTFDLRNELEALQSKLQETRETLGQVRERQSELNEEQEQTENQTRRNIDAHEDLITALRTREEAMQAVRDDIAEIGRQAEEAEGEIRRFSDAVRDMSGARLFEQEDTNFVDPQSLNDLEETIRMLREARDAQTDPEQAAAIQRRIEALQEEREELRAQLGLIEQQEEQLTTMQQIGLNVGQSLANSMSQFASELAVAGGSIESLQDALQELGNIGRQILQQLIQQLVQAKLLQGALGLGLGGGVGGAIGSAGGIGTVAARAPAAAQGASIQLQASTSVTAGGDLVTGINETRRRRSRGMGR